ncbi:hypothetical protein DL765_000516 [Monosporascus sp. GIB2]|nr:hypothetical protein DL765_000516 [Monosporascus sp. GIB2]
MKRTAGLAVSALMSTAVTAWPSPALDSSGRLSSSRAVVDGWDIPEYLKLSELYGAPPNDFSCESDRNPVVLLHGLSANREVDLNMLQKHLKERGYCTFSRTYGAHRLAPWIGGLTAMADSARDVAAFVREVHERTGARKKVDLVGHSEGGVMALYVPMTQEGVSDIVEHTVALGPAIHGAKYFGFTDLWYAGGQVTRNIASAVVKALGCAACDDMATGGAVYNEFLNAEKVVQDGNKATVIVSRSDTLVAPDASRIDEEGVRNVFVQDTCPDDKVGHAGLMWDRSVWGLVINALEETPEEIGRPLEAGFKADENITAAQKEPKMRKLAATVLGGFWTGDEATSVQFDTSAGGLGNGRLWHDDLLTTKPDSLAGGYLGLHLVIRHSIGQGARGGSTFWEVCPNTNPSLLGADEIYQSLVAQDENWPRCAEYMGAFPCGSTLGFTPPGGDGSGAFYEPGRFPPNGTATTSNIAGSITSPVSGATYTWTYNGVPRTVTVVSADARPTAKGEAVGDTADSEGQNQSQDGGQDEGQNEAGAEINNEDDKDGSAPMITPGWKQVIEQKIQTLEDKIATIVNDDSSSSHALQPARRPENASSESEVLPNSSTHGGLSTEAEEATGLRIVVDLESSPGTLPGHYLHPAAPAQPRVPRDIISRGIITAENARRYQSVYQDRLDHFLYGILGDHSTATFEDTLQKSPILSTAICAVGALHLASADYEALYKEFIALSAAMSFSRRNTTDDVRALCIGAFWMNDLSSSLVSFAVRIAAELQLHRSFSKALQGDRESYLRARLYYLVYACDHHLSIPHGRPPITRECEAVRDVRKFLECRHATEDDARLVSQVLRWSVCTSIYDTFGADVDRPLSDVEVPQVRRFSIALDSLRAEWADRFSPNVHVGNYPRKGVGIQYHFAKLYLFSHALRGLGSGQVQYRACDVDMEVYELASSAVLSAVSILRTIVSDPEIQSYLNGLPTYFHIMIAFAVVFLLKVSTRFSSSVQIDIQEVQRLMTKLIEVLQEVSRTMHRRHLLVTITECIEDILRRNFSIPAPVTNAAPSSSHQRPAQVLHDPVVDRGDYFAEGALNQFLLNEYDFLVNHVQEPML